MATYLRFTKNFQSDLEKGYSYFKTPSMKKAVKLQGICAFKFDYENLTEEETINIIKQYASNQYYLDCSTAVLFDADYIESNKNGEGSIVKPNYLIKQYFL